MSSVGAEGYGEHTSGVSNGPSTALTPIDALGSIHGECLHTLDSVWRHLPVDASQRVNISRNDARTIGDNTRSVCPESARQLAVDTFQIFTVEEPADTICQASELKATESTLAVCPTALPLHSHLSMHWEASTGNACTHWTASGGTCLWMLHRVNISRNDARTIGAECN